MGNIFNSTLRRNKPLKAKKGFKPRSQGFKKRPVTASGCPPRGFSYKKVSGQRKGLRKRSKQLQKRLTTEYYPAQKEFLSKPENRFCQICLCRSLDLHLSEVMKIIKNHGLEDAFFAGAELTEATECHHLRGRSGKLLSDARFFVSSCYWCRLWPHDNKKEARKLGLLAEAKDWGVLPHEESTSIEIEVKT